MPPSGSFPAISLVVSTVSKELQEGQYDEMVDYEPSLKCLYVNVVYFSSKGDFIGDDARMA